MERLSFASAAVGAVLLLGAPIGWQLSQPEASVGEVPTSSTVAEAPAATQAIEPAPAAKAAPDGNDGSDEATSGSEAPQAPPPAPPRALRLPTLGVEAPVVDVGLEDDGGMEIPEDISTVGWYEPGVLPGDAAGTAVISGHVDSYDQGRGAFWDLRRMDVDDIVVVEHADGTTSEWRVVARRSYPKDELPISDIFTRFGEPRLVLITCDGEFDLSQRSYADNVVVYTVPVDA
jgi:hypothetical protein